MIIALVAFGTLSMANTNKKGATKEETNTTSVKTEEVFATTCCTRRGTSSNGQSIAVTACVESTKDHAIDMGNACGKATEIVKANVKYLDANPL